MGRRTRLLRLGKTAIVVVFFSSLMQASIAQSGHTTIIGVDLGMSDESLSMSKRLLGMLLSQADAGHTYGLVTSDELVRTIVDPIPAKELLATISDLTLEPSDTANISTLLERSLAMSEEGQTPRLWIFSSGAIALSTNDASKQDRFEMWASDILLPDIAAHYEEFRLITPETSNQNIVNAVVSMLGNESHLMLPKTDGDLAQLVDSLTSENITIASASSTLTDGSDNQISTAQNIEPKTSEPVAVNTTDSVDSSQSVTTLLTAESNDTEATATLSAQTTIEQGADNSVTNTVAIKPETLPAPEKSIELDKKPDPSQQSPTVTDSEKITTIASRETPDVASSSVVAQVQAGEADSPSDDLTRNQANTEEPLDTASITTEVQSTSIDTTTNAASTDSTAPVTDTDTTDQIVQASESTSASEPNQVLETTPETPTTGFNVINMTLILITLAVISTLTFVLVTLLRKRRRYRTTDSKHSQPGSKSSATRAFDHTPKQPQMSDPTVLKPTAAAKPPSQNVDLESETVLFSKPGELTQREQVSTTDTTDVILNDNKEKASKPSSITEDFSAFERSIIEKRWAKMNEEELEPSDQK